MTSQTLPGFVPDTADKSETYLDERSFGNLWDPAENMDCWTFIRDVSYLLQLTTTAIPVWLADMTAVGLSVVLTTMILNLAGGMSPEFAAPHIISWCIALSAACLLSGLYPAVGMNAAIELKLITKVIATVVTLCVAYDVFHGGDNKFLMIWPLYGLFMVAFVPLLRALFRRAVCNCSWWGLRTIVIGAGDRGFSILRQMRKNPSLGFKPVAIVDRYRSEWMLDDEQLPICGIASLEDTPALSSKLHAYCGIYVGTEFPDFERMDMVDALTSVFPQLYITTDSADAGREWSGNLLLGTTRLLRVTENLLMPGARWIKRIIDISAILMVAPMIVPLVALLAILVKITSPGPAFYNHLRIGRNGRPIRVWKLRSMVPNADVMLKEYLAKNPHLRSEWERIHKLPNDPRVTTIERILRKTSLDEIPQLWNVFCGDMSLVGPRPIVQAEIPKYQAVYPLYLRVTPGITGLWQVNGRNSTTYEERISYDAEYVRNWSVCLDFYILARTVQTVVTCDGAC